MPKIQEYLFSENLKSTGNFEIFVKKMRLRDFFIFSNIVLQYPLGKIFLKEFSLKRMVGKYKQQRLSNEAYFHFSMSSQMCACFHLLAKG